MASGYQKQTDVDTTLEEYDDPGKSKSNSL